MRTRSAATPRIWSAALATAALALAVGGCGGSRDASSTRKANGYVVVPNFSTHHNDRDNDGDHNDDDGKVLGFGHPADAADRRSLEGLVSRYFAAAAAKDGAAGCRLLVPFIAETTAEQQGQSPELRGTTCPVVLSKLFAEHHPLLATKHATLRFVGTRVEGDRALVVLDFPTIPEVRQISARHVGGGWRLLELLDGILE